LLASVLTDDLPEAEATIENDTIDMIHDAVPFLLYRPPENRNRLESFPVFRRKKPPPRSNLEVNTRATIAPP
jgi:hypothetical protein